MRSILQPDGTLKEMPDMEKPGDEPECHEYSYYESKFYHSCHPFSGPDEEYSHCWRLHDEWQEQTEAYNAALSKCRQLQVVGSHGWKIGDVIEENIHYKLGFSVPKDKSGSAGIVAIPISNNQDDLWKEIYEVADKQVWVRFEAGQDVSKTMYYRDVIDYLKNHFTITRK